MDPVTIAALGSVASAGAQWLGSEEARKANAKERKKMQEMMDKIQAPNFDPSQFTAEEYKVAAKYVPEVAAFVEEAAPQVIRENEEMALGRRAQREALERLSDIGSSRGIDPQMQALANEAARKTQTEAQVRQQSILQDAARRGQQGSAATLAAQLMSSSAGMDRASQTQNDLAAQAYQQRLAALADSGQMGGQLRQQEANLQKTNADIINDFNRRNTSRRQEYLQGNVDTSNAAQRFNVGQMQDIANKNVGGRNDATLFNRKRADDIERARYDADMGKFGAMSGLSGQRQQANVQSAQDRNQAIQAGTNVFTGYMQGSAAEKASKDAQDREDRRAQYMRDGKWPS